MVINKNITNTNRRKAKNRNIKYLAIHYVGAVSSAKNNTVYFKSAYRGSSAHYFVDDTSIWQCVEEKDTAWHCGALRYYNGCRNNNSISIELCCVKNNGVLDITEKTIANAIELAKDIMKRYNIPIENVVRHYDVTHKKCPAPFVSDVSRWNDFKNRLVDAPKTETKKSIDAIAKEVLAGKWGNGEDRRTRLTKAGYNYAEVQAKVNELAGGKSAKKSVTEIAKEVINGKWGNGATRKSRLTKAGYNYEEVQKEVNRLLK